MKVDKILAVRNTKTIYREGEVCVKLFSEKYPKSYVLREALNHSYIEETGLKIPKIKEVTCIDGEWAIESEYIKGTTLLELVRKNDSRKMEYMDRFIQLHATVMGLECKSLGRLADRMNENIAKADLEATTRYDMHMKLLEASNTNNICHGDFNLSNIIITQEDDAYVVDWSKLSRGDSRVDMANTYLILLLEEGEELATYYLNKIIELMSVTKESVMEWVPLVAAFRSVEAKKDVREKLLSFMDYQNGGTA